jgi:hypothetical protein
LYKYSLPVPAHIIDKAFEGRHVSQLLPRTKADKLTGYPEPSFSWFLSQFVHANARIIPQIRP